MSTNQAVIEVLEAAEAARCDALLKQQIDALESLIGDDLHYVHSSATAEDKALYLARLRDKYYVYHGLQSLAREWRVFNDLALCNGDIGIEVEVKGARKHIKSRYLQVWAKRASGWQMISWHSTPMPA
ncbi:MAG: nuclear transport factor 2 family protein [Burkholderiales bacterium]|jgi:ketosteroid isomerase-like protein